MTPQERQRVAELFDRLAQLESTPRERDAEAAIVEGLRQAPHAPYALVQTVLIQEEALERANARIRELEDSDGSIAPRQGGFLDAMREAFSGQPRAPRASVPVTRRPGEPRSGAPMGAPPGFQQNAAQRRATAAADRPRRLVPRPGRLDRGGCRRRQHGGRCPARPVRRRQGLGRGVRRARAASEQRERLRSGRC